MKKVLIFVICVLFLLQGVQFVSYAESRTMYYSENFNSCQVGSFPVSGLSRGHTIAVVERGGEKMGSIIINMENSQGSPYFDKNISVTGGNVIVEADVSLNNCDSKAHSYIGVKNENGELLQLFSMKNNEIKSLDGTVISLIKAGRIYRLSAMLDLANKKCSVYVDGEMKKSNIPMNASAITTLRFMTMSLVSGSKLEWYFDNLMVYGGSTPMSEGELSGVNTVSDDIQTRIRNRIQGMYIFYDGAEKAYFNSRIYEMSTPAFKEKTFYLPVRDVIETMHGTVIYDSDKNTVRVTLGNSMCDFSPGMKEVILNGQSIELENEIIMRNAKTYIPAELFGKLTKLEVQEDNTGFVAIGASEKFLNWEAEKKIMCDLFKYLNYKRPTGEKVVGDVVKNNPDKCHPRLFANSNDFEAIKSLIKTDDFAGKVYENIKKEADSYLTQAVTVFKMDDAVRAMGCMKKAEKIILTCSMMYKLLGEEVYAERAKDEMMSLCSDENYPDWNPYQMLGIGHPTTGLAVGYDWCYEYLSEDEKALVRKSLKEKAFVHYMNDVNGLSKGNNAAGRPEPYNDMIRSTMWRELIERSNWTGVINGGITVAALAICDEEDSMEYCAEVLESSIKDIEGLFDGFVPDGAWFEGLGYWQYSTQYLVKMLAGLESSCGTDYGLSDSPGINLTLSYALGIQGPGGSANFSDNGGLYTVDACMFWLADRYNQHNYIDVIKSHYERHEVTKTPYDLIFYNKSLSNVSHEGEYKEMDSYWREIETVVMRNTFDESNGNYMAMHGGRNDAPHAHLDAGNFWIDAYGKRFACDLGTEDYNLNSAGGANGFNLYRKNPQGHNLLCFNPINAGQGQITNAGAYIETFEHNNSSAFAITDLKDVWADYVDEYKRGIMMCNKKQVFIVQDEVTPKNNVEDMYWFMHTEADIEILEDGKTAILTIDDVKLKVKILTDTEYVFEEFEAKGLEGSAPALIEGQKDNLNYRKLGIHINSNDKMTLSIGFVPFYDDEQVPDDSVFGTVVPMSEWQLESEEGVVDVSDVYLENIYVDGVAIENFSKEKNEYNYELKSGSTEVPEITADADKESEIKITNAKELPGKCVITVSKGGAKKRYRIYYRQKPEIAVPDGILEYGISQVSASAEPQPQNNKENSIDNDFGTRWSALGPCFIQYDLGSVQSLDYVGIAYYLGKERTVSLDILLSEDGENWETIFSGESSGETDELEYYNCYGHNARYIKLLGYETNVGTWVSITEFKAYEKR